VSDDSVPVPPSRNNVMISLSISIKAFHSKCKFYLMSRQYSQDMSLTDLQAELIWMYFFLFFATPRPSNSIVVGGRKFMGFGFHGDGDFTPPTAPHQSDMLLLLETFTGSVKQT